jgi:hypothetical protein
MTWMTGGGRLCQAPHPHRSHASLPHPSPPCPTLWKESESPTAHDPVLHRPTPHPPTNARPRHKTYTSLSAQGPHHHNAPRTLGLFPHLTHPRRSSFSSYPGMLSSLDDFYVMPDSDQRLVMLQTTNVRAHSWTRLRLGAALPTVLTPARRGPAGDLCLLDARCRLQLHAQKVFRGRSSHTLLVPSPIEAPTHPEGPL